MRCKKQMKPLLGLVRESSRQAALIVCSANLCSPSSSSSCPFAISSSSSLTFILSIFSLTVSTSFSFPALLPFFFCAFPLLSSSFTSFFTSSSDPSSTTCFSASSLALFLDFPFPFFSVFVTSLVASALSSASAGEDFVSLFLPIFQNFCQVIQVF